MRNIRREATYQCIAIDLAMLGVITREQCELLIGGGIPNNLVLPNNTSVLAPAVETPDVTETPDATDTPDETDASTETSEE